MAIASIANWDWPEEWPGLMDYLIRLINDRTDVNKGIKVPYKYHSIIWYYSIICEASLRCALYLCIEVTNTDIVFWDSAWSIAMLSLICW